MLSSYFVGLVFQFSDSGVEFDSNLYQRLFYLVDGLWNFLIRIKFVFLTIMLKVY